jgi:hypothetical protein
MKFGILLLSTIAPALIGQERPGTAGPQNADATTVQPSQSDAQPVPLNPERRRILGIIPNYRTYPTLRDYRPITAREKFGIAINDSFDRGTAVMASAFAAERQITASTPDFGQEQAGYARYIGTAYADLVIGDFMTEAIYPAILRQDPRYFRRGTGAGWSRAAYAVGQIFWTRSDRGRGQFNFSEVLGNSTAVAISNAYYPNNRTPGAAVSNLAVQLGVDMAGNLLKEFWPDLADKFTRKHQATNPPSRLNP